MENIISVDQILSNHAVLKFEDYKLSYIMLKPNAARHYGEIVEEIRSNQFTIVNQYAVFDFETATMALHMDQPSALRYLIPISHLYHDFYGNYGIVLLLAKRDITYPNFCLQIVRLKEKLRAKYKVSYLSYVFDLSKLGMENKHQMLRLIAKDGSDLEKDDMNQEGTYMVFHMNEIHSPGGTEEETIKELELLKNMGIISSENIVPPKIIVFMKKYGTFEFLKNIIRK